MIKFCPISINLKEHAIEPAPDRKGQTTWKTFIKAHWDVLAAIDFTTVEVWTRGTLVTFYLLVVMELTTRRIHFAGCTPNPDATWMTQIGRSLMDCVDGFLNGKRDLFVSGLRSDSQLGRDRLAFYLMVSLVAVPRRRGSQHPECACRGRGGLFRTAEDANAMPTGN